MERSVRCLFCTYHAKNSSLNHPMCVFFNSWVDYHGGSLTQVFNDDDNNSPEIDRDSDDTIEDDSVVLLFHPTDWF